MLQVPYIWEMENFWDASIQIRGNAVFTRLISKSPTRDREGREYKIGVKSVIGVVVIDKSNNRLLRAVCRLDRYGSIPLEDPQIIENGELSIICPPSSYADRCEVLHADSINEWENRRQPLAPDRRTQAPTARSGWRSIKSVW